MENITGQDSVPGDILQSSLDTTEAHNTIPIAVQPGESTEDEVDLFDCFSDTFDDIDWDTFDRSTGLIPNACSINADTADTVTDATEDHATQALATELEAAPPEPDEDKNSTYSFEELDESVFLELDAIEARFSQDPAAFSTSVPWNLKRDNVRTPIDW